jgi:hypothetical protein
VALAYLQFLSCRGFSTMFPLLSSIRHNQNLALTQRSEPAARENLKSECHGLTYVRIQMISTPSGLRYMQSCPSGVGHDNQREKGNL